MQQDKGVKSPYNYLTEDEAKMDRDLVNAQILLGLKTCKTGGDVIELLNDVREHERKQLAKDLIGKECTWDKVKAKGWPKKYQGLKDKEEDSEFCSYCEKEMPVFIEFETITRVYHCPECLRVKIREFELGER